MDSIGWDGKREENVPINHVHNTIGNQYIRSNNFSGIDIDATVDDADGYLTTADGFKSGVLEERAITHGALHDVILEDGGRLFRGEVVSCGGDGCEGAVGWSLKRC